VSGHHHRITGTDLEGAAAKAAVAEEALVLLREEAEGKESDWRKQIDDLTAENLQLVKRRATDRAPLSPA
jgi:hypothetical protein